jgi:hypothetical protein
MRGHLSKSKLQALSIPTLCLNRSKNVPTEVARSIKTGLL